MARLRIRDLQRAESDLRPADRQLPGPRRIGADASNNSSPRCSATTTSNASSTASCPSKLHAATIAENIERNRSGEQFTVLYPATLPHRADQAGALARDADRESLPASASARVRRSAVSIWIGRFTTSSDLRDEFQLPVLGEVTRIQPV